MENPNTVEFIVTDEGVIAVVTTPEGDINTVDMTLEEFARLERALEITV